jgi:hypothetical protein
MPMVTEPSGPERPTLTIKPPAIGKVVVPTTPAPLVAEADQDVDAKLQALERQLVEVEARRQIAMAHRDGKSSPLKRLIVVSGPMDTAVSRSANAPASKEKVALIGLKDSEVRKRVEQFFGAPMTPDREKALLETVKTQLATGKDQGGLEVNLAGWWPAEGVMAVSVTQKKS